MYFMIHNKIWLTLQNILIRDLNLEKKTMRRI